MIRKYQNKLFLKGVECFKLHTPKVCLYLKLQIRSQHLPLLMFNKYVYKDHIDAWTYQAFLQTTGMTQKLFTDRLITYT